jgi:geranylgeranyl reductase family protein
VHSGSVVIVGAGPSGTAAAITLRRAGLQVVVIDKAVFPRDKCCGDGLTSGALRLLDGLGVDPATIPTWKPATDVWICGPDGHNTLFPLPKGPGQYAATAAREELDAALVELAKNEGTDVREGVALEDVHLYEDRVEVVTDRGVIVADWCIAADGMWSPTRKALGLGPTGYRGEWHAFRQYWRNVSPRAASELFVWFEPDIIPGYVWSFPMPGNRANVGFGVQRSTHKTGDMNELWRSLLERPHIREILGPDAKPEAPHRAWPIPARVGELPLTAHRTFFVGDATGACDPMTGEGIGQALHTGIWAASSIIEATNPPAAAAHYERATERELAVDMRFAGRLGAVLGNKTAASAALRTASLTHWTSRNFARWLFEDYPRALLGTPRRWTRDVFSQPGAYAGERTPT